MLRYKTNRRNSDPVGKESKAMAKGAPIEYYDLPESECPDVVYFSSVSQNTHRFVQKLERPALRLPLHPREEGMPRVCRPYILIVPTYGGGHQAAAVPKQVIHFLNDPQNRSLIRGVIVSGNTNFGEHYCIAGPIIAQKCNVPILYRFELLGTPRDVQTVRDLLDDFWQK
ncbi:class Ib ribonucleoside-diphosphate reductase assembly flavoprotein NrdI [Mobiluncus mulieris]|nr:class Ib ribonucleoside-diphosphate reductase assembly flavoprotein NrdI [Mobiluncus mulieris]EEJ53485.1 nrdI protein [Mobiluncus mulieris ATCC 35243]MCU9970757.1 class Ib ribonucleoside-diphosphate reductase assembly flavoprotein NrdI [Mobiluncus mulieris]MCV0011636.1 class Ib ribonucleoside-diphosphate reductase assembly flavoprotein NrdI [Mobiluncus mulieris]NMW62732.1 class Ib ribonucleoside-diphosphate reductase assembly flavoprotein NrdI [Mobiluncus mulieris]NMW90206.1 class Ib ribonu